MRAHLRTCLISFCLVAGLQPGLWGGAPGTAPQFHGVDAAGIDPSVAPGSDFYAYANGTWMQKVSIPDDRSSYGNGAMVAERTEQRTVQIIQGLSSQKAPQGSEARKIADYYASFMDEAAIEALGIKPLQPMLEGIAALRDRKGLAVSLGRTLRADVDALNNTNFYTDHIFGLWVAQDLDQPTRYSPFLFQGGLGMPDRDYYLDPSPRMEAIRKAYQSHIARMLKLAGISDAEAKAARIFSLEMRIAGTHTSREDSTEVTKGNNHWTRRDFTQKAAGLDWPSFFAAAGLGKQADFVVWHPSAISGISSLAASEPLETWKDYLAFHAIEHHAPFLPKAFVEEHFAFHGQLLSGTPQMQARWKRGVGFTSEALGEAVGKLYVEKHFPPAEKARVQAMVKQLLEAFGKRIDRLEWMTPATKLKAKAKLATLKVSVGYPDRWRDYGSLAIRPGEALANAQRAERFELERNLKKLGQPVDRDEWVMTPQTVNAVNLPVMNALNFPAAILQAPDCDPENPLASNYGAIGAVIGHEISHSFDDQGALFDATGKLQNWWSEADLVHFKTAATRLVKQYDAYRPFPDLAVNGKLTLGENIADVAGLATAYDAFHAALQGQEAPIIHGLSGDQQFFIAFAQSWREKRREPARRRQILGDGHAPAEYRADTVRNLDAWYEAFGVQPGQALYLAPADRVRLW